MQERAFKGIWIPAEILLNENLSVMEKFLYAEIDSFCGRGRECYAANIHFAKIMQVSERRIQQLLVSLEEKGMIRRRVVYKEGTKEVLRRYLKAIPPTPFDTTPPEENFTTPGEENFVTPPEESFTPPPEENFTIDNILREHIENTPIPPEGGEARSSDTGRTDERFEEFWKAYPRKVGKGAALKAYKRIKPSADLSKAMLLAVEKQKRSDQWRKDNGQYIPNPSTWLNQRRWDDEMPCQPQNKSKGAYYKPDGERIRFVN